MHKRLILLIFSIVAALSAAVIIFETTRGEPPRSAGIGGPFRLMSQNGEMIDSEKLKGKPYAIFFGFTHCPEVCPTTMMELSGWLRKLGPEAADFKTYFVSVDPERDTKEMLRDYLSAFSDNFIGLIGSNDEIADVAKKFRVYYKKVPLKDGDYTMDHSAIIYLMGSNGLFRDVVGYGEPENVALKKLNALLTR